MAARKKPANGLPLELMDAMVREYGEWRRRVEAEDPNAPAPLSADELFMLESHRLAHDAVKRLRRMIFADLLRRGFPEQDICQRLLIGHKTYVRLATRLFGVDDAKVIRAECTARNQESQRKLNSELSKMEDLRQKNNGFTNAERQTYFQLIKLKRELDESLRELHSADVPERKEFVETKQYAVILLPVEPSQDAKRTIIDVTQSGIPLLINSTPMDKTNGDT
jgi:hypothetical protein